MFKTEKIEELVEAALMSGFIKNDVPLSLMLIAPPECAKTSILQGFDCFGTYQTMDLSPKGIRDKIVPKLDSGEMHHLIIPDLLKLMAHRSETVMATITFLNAIMEEGIKDGDFCGQEFHLKKFVKCGVMTSITESKFTEVFKKWHDIGFTSRFVPVAYDYYPSTVNEIHKKISDEVCFTNKKSIKHRGYKSAYNIPIKDEDIKVKIVMMVDDITKREMEFRVPVYTQAGVHYAYPDLNPKGFRLHRQLNQFTRAFALMRNRKKPVVEAVDFLKMKDLFEYINLPNSKKSI